MMHAEEPEAFEPTIIAFLCNWCAYAGADLAGTQRLGYPPNVRVIRLMCSSLSTTPPIRCSTISGT